MNRAEIIFNLCEKYRQEVTKGNGIEMGNESEKYRLRNNNIHFHELSFDEIEACCIGLTYVLIYKNYSTIVDWDHYNFWAWSAELLLTGHSNYFSDEECEIKELFSNTIRMALAGVQDPDVSREEWEKQREVKSLLDQNTNEILIRKVMILAYLSFPLLESTLKKCCRNYIDYSGIVLQAFTGKSRTYSIGSRCSSLRDLLILFYNQIADASLRHNIDKLFKYFSEISTTNPFDLIYEWRNSSLHGSTSHSTIGGVVINLTILIALSQVKDRYDEMRGNIQNQLNSHWKSFRSHWSYYPPY